MIGDLFEKIVDKDVDKIFIEGPHFLAPDIDDVSIGAVHYNKLFSELHTYFNGLHHVEDYSKITIFKKVGDVERSYVKVYEFYGSGIIEAVIICDKVLVPTVKNTLKDIGYSFDSPKKYKMTKNDCNK